MRLALVVMMGVSWFALANHCEVAAAIVSARAQLHSCCENNKDTTKIPAKDEGNRQCCKEFYPIALSLDQKPGSSDLPSIDYTYLAAVVLFFSAPITRGSIEQDTGPPIANSFAEIVLQRSILAHAPPSLV